MIKAVNVTIMKEIFIDEETMFARDMIERAAIISERYGRVRITTTDGQVYEGWVSDVSPEFNDDGDETPWDCVHLDIDENTYEAFANWEIEKVEKA